MCLVSPVTMVTAGLFQTPAVNETPGAKHSLLFLHVAVSYFMIGLSLSVSHREGSNYKLEMKSFRA